LRRTLRLSYQPWVYVHGNEADKLRTELGNVIPGEVLLFASGRQSLLAILKAMKVSPGDEVIVQGYTCVVVPNAILAAKATPVYADIDPDTLNLTVQSVRESFTDRTRAVIVQHTFGIPGPVSELRELLRGKNIILIEDLAHVLPDSRDDMVGKDGDCSILSFGRDKAISGVAGGAVVCRNRHIVHGLHAEAKKATHVPWQTVLRHLEYGPRMHSLVRPFAGSMFLKVMLKILMKLRLIEPVLTRAEKAGKMSDILERIPNACAGLARASLANLQSINVHRRMLTALYLHEAKQAGWTFPASITAALPLQKFPIFVQGADQIRQKLKKEKIFLEDGWNTCTICPMDVSESDVGYVRGSDPHAESVGMQILNLPTHPGTTVDDAKRLIQALQRMM
jgi:perosamine synthetase